MNSIGRYEVVGRIGSGGFATVYRARDPVLDSEVAVKVLADNWAGNDEIRERFIREAQILRRIDSDRVVTVHDIGELPSGQPYFVMALADRGTLDGRLAGEQQPTLADVTTIARAMADCVTVVHSHGLIHRDIKPSNLLIAGPTRGSTGPAGAGALLSPSERLVLGDFGLAKDIELQNTGLTIAAGSGGYAAPEQMALAGTPSRRTDLFAATAVMCRVLSGSRPPGFDLANRMVPFPEGAWWMSGALGAFFRQGMAYEPDDRHDSIDHWFAELTAAMAPYDSPAVSPDAPTSALPSFSQLGPRIDPTSVLPQVPDADPRSARTQVPSRPSAPSGYPSPAHSDSGYPGAGHPNTGQPSTGYPNTGHPNTGYPNPAYPNPGYPDTGQPNTGYPNPAYPNPGYPNTGQPNTGYPNPAYPNPGYPNTGQPNTGYSNTGYPPDTGYSNTGYSNTGYSNTGHPGGPVAFTPGAAPRRSRRWFLVGLAGAVAAGGAAAGGFFLLRPRGPEIVGPAEIPAGDSGLYEATFAGADSFEWSDPGGATRSGPTLEVDGQVPGSVRISVVALTGGARSAPTTRVIEIVAAPDGPVIEGPPEITIGETAVYSFSFVDEWTGVVWILPDGSESPGELFEVTPSSPGSFRIRLLLTRPDGSRIGAARIVQLVS